MLELLELFVLLVVLAMVMMSMMAMFGGNDMDGGAMGFGHVATHDVRVGLHGHALRVHTGLHHHRLLHTRLHHHLLLRVHTRLHHHWLLHTRLHHGLLRVWVVHHTWLLGRVHAGLHGLARRRLHHRLPGRHLLGRVTRLLLRRIAGLLPFYLLRILVRLMLVRVVAVPDQIHHCFVFERTDWHTRDLVS